MKDFDFDKVAYTRYRDYANPFVLSSLPGFDTEAKSTGEPFLLGDSDGREFRPRRVLSDMLKGDDKRRDYGVWNLRYDSGAVLYFLPFDVKDKLRREGEARINAKTYKLAVPHQSKKGGTSWDRSDIVLKYIPHKHLSVRQGRKARNFWDIMPFYHSSLDAAAEEYLGERKMKMETKTFTEAYIRKHLPKIRRYWKRDMKLTEKLAAYLLKYLADFGIKARTLYSTASVSAQHFRNTCPYIHVWRFWKYQRDVLRASCEAYYGGKFEITSRGRFTGYEWDIVNAYGSEMTKLLDLRYAKVRRGRAYDDESEYAFIRCIVDNRKGVHTPTTYKRKGLNIYPAGRFHTTITKAEYDYLRSVGVTVTIKDAYWFRFEKKEYPYRKEVIRLYRIKERFKKSNPMKSRTAKTLVNSFYGKWVQIIDEPDGTLRAGVYWNPIYAAIVTANIRVRMCRFQQELGEKCLAVHTDSVLTTVPLPKKYISSKLGGMELKHKGDGVIIACGVYQIGEKSANRGYFLDEEHSWLKLLADNPGAKEIMMDETMVLSWTGQVALGKDEDINLFTDVQKTLNLNCEQKRVWSGPTTTDKLLAGLEHSSPPIVFER